VDFAAENNLCRAEITSYISRSPHQGRDEFLTLLSGFFVACILTKRRFLL
jgi:hypothetical protein